MLSVLVQSVHSHAVPVTCAPKTAPLTDFPPRLYKHLHCHASNKVRWPAQKSKLLLT